MKDDSRAVIGGGAMASTVAVVRWMHKPVCSHVYSSPIYAIFRTREAAEGHVRHEDVTPCGLVVEEWALTGLHNSNYRPTRRGPGPGGPGLSLVPSRSL